MKRLLTLALTLSVILPAVVGGQDKKTTDVKIQGHVYEPAKLEPSDELVARLRVPEGFRVRKFAELQNPRMLAVGPDRMLYITSGRTCNECHETTPESATMVGRPRGGEVPRADDGRPGRLRAEAVRALARR